MTITRPQAEALTAFIERCRPDWNRPGILAAIQRAAPIAAPADIGTAICRLAANPQMRTPTLLAEPGPHWAATPAAERRPPTSCGEHPKRLARNCPDCTTELANVDHAARAAEMRDAIRAMSAERRRLRQGATQ